MKTKFYIFLILLLSFSFANAQDQTSSNEIQASIVLEDDNTTVDVSNTIESNTTNEEVLIETSLDQKEIARNSDIRTYLNKLRNVDNINLLFPKIFKEKIA